MIISYVDYVKTILQNNITTYEKDLINKRVFEFCDATPSSMCEARIFHLSYSKAWQAATFWHSAQHTAKDPTLSNLKKNKQQFNSKTDYKKE